MQPSVRDLSNGMYGAWRLARFDAGAMAWFDRSPQGVWRSFWSMALCYPANILIVLSVATPEKSGSIWTILLVESIGFVISWVGFLLIALAFCRWLERDQQVLDFIVAYNWAQVLQTALSLGLLLAVRVLPSAPAELVYVGVLLLAYVYEWFVARTALEAGGVAAAALVLIDLALSKFVAQASQALY
jgi:hypothetical protein